MTWGQLALLLFPVLVIMISGQKWPLRQLGDKIPWRPPPQVFGVAWALLSISIGVAWAFGSPNEVSNNLRGNCFVLLTLLLFSFAPLEYSKGPSVGPAICASSFGVALACMLTTAPPYNLLLVPLCAWLVFAGQLAALSAA